jgi:hypothetical protein
MVFIQYSSDLHIDKFPKGTSFYSFITPVAPILILAGDVCPALHTLFTPFLTWCSRHWHTVILVAGNHEYYCKEQIIVPHTEIDVRIYAITERLKNIIYLQNAGKYVIPNTNITVIGSTLWSHIDENIHEEIRGKKGEYRYIYVGPEKPATPHDITALHTSHKAALRAAIQSTPDNQTIIVITHHMPTERLLEPEYRQEAWRSCYASCDEDLFSKQIHTWICGHGHRSTTIRHKKMTLRMNARGYNKPSELERTVDIYSPTRCFGFST